MNLIIEINNQKFNGDFSQFRDKILNEKDFIENVSVKNNGGFNKEVFGLICLIENFKYEQNNLYVEKGFDYYVIKTNNQTFDTRTCFDYDYFDNHNCNFEEILKISSLIPLLNLRPLKSKEIYLCPFNNGNEDWVFLRKSFGNFSKFHYLTFNKNLIVFGESIENLEKIVFLSPQNPIFPQNCRKFCFYNNFTIFDKFNSNYINCKISRNRVENSVLIINRKRIEINYYGTIFFQNLAENEKYNLLNIFLENIKRIYPLVDWETAFDRQENEVENFNNVVNSVRTFLETSNIQKFENSLKDIKDNFNF